MASHSVESGGLTEAHVSQIESGDPVGLEPFHDWDDIRNELDDGDIDALAAEGARTEAWVRSFNLVEGTPTPGAHPALDREML